MELFILPKCIIRSTKDRIIPYKIHQTFKTNKIPKHMYNAAQSYIQMNLEYNYFFYDDDDINNILDVYDCSEFTFSSDNLKKAYNKMNTGAGKADIFRYMILYTEGGCYFDIDTVCLNPLDIFINDDDELVSGLGERCDLHQWGMIYKKGHPFIKRTLEKCITNILNETYVDEYKNSLEGLTGPPCLDYSIKEVLGLPANYKFKKGKYTIGNYKFNILNGDFFGNNIQFKYKEYFTELKSMNINYWVNCKIFK